ILQRLAEWDRRGVLLVHVEEIDGVAGLCPIEHAILDNRHVEAIREAIHHGCPYAAAGALSGDQQRVDAARLHPAVQVAGPKRPGAKHLPLTRRAVEGGTVTLCQESVPHTLRHLRISFRYDAGIISGPNPASMVRTGEQHDLFDYTPFPDRPAGAWPGGAQLAV